VPIAAPDLSLVINNAGTQRLTDFVREDPLAVLPALRAEIAANLTGVVALSIGLLPLLARQPSRRW
jgi:short-subunit dehydrogenase involved in D-alanine esterification of teichoic acids